jgi:hypothetical protein
MAQRQRRAASERNDQARSEEHWRNQARSPPGPSPDGAQAIADHFSAACRHPPSSCDALPSGRVEPLKIERASVSAGGQYASGSGHLGRHSGSAAGATEVTGLRRSHATDRKWSRPQQAKERQPSGL